jgi:hypothetical protein
VLGGNFDLAGGNSEQRLAVDDESRHAQTLHAATPGHS